MIKLLKNSFKLKSKLGTFTCTFRKYHTHFNEKCNQTFEFSTLTTYKPNMETFRISQLRITGVRMQLEYYDSHCYEPKLRYLQSVPTILVLPSSEHDIKQYDYLIGSLVENNYRVLALKFPGVLLIHFFNNILFN